jgi:hypothetical protein
VVNDTFAALSWFGGKTLSQCAVSGLHVDAEKFATLP